MASRTYAAVAPLNLSLAETKIVEAHLKAIDEAKSSFNESILTIGEHLRAIHEIVTGHFEEYVEKHCKFSRTTAYKYMHAFDVFGKRRDIIDHFDIGAIYALSRESTPDEAFERAATEAKKHGRYIDETKAIKIIGECKSPPAPDEGSVNQVHTSNGRKTSKKREPAKKTGGTKGVPFDPDTAKRPTASGPEDNPADDEEPDRDEYEAWEAEQPATEPIRPFARLVELPDDMAEAFESFKLSILRHKLNGWLEISCDGVVDTLDALKQLAKAPSEKAGVGR